MYSKAFIGAAALVVLVALVAGYASRPAHAADPVVTAWRLGAVPTKVTSGQAGVANGTFTYIVQRADATGGAVKLRLQGYAAPNCPSFTEWSIGWDFQGDDTRITKGQDLPVFQSMARLDTNSNCSSDSAPTLYVNGNGDATDLTYRDVDQAHATFYFNNSTRTQNPAIVHVQRTRDLAGGFFTVTIANHDFQLDISYPYTAEYGSSGAYTGTAPSVSGGFGLLVTSSAVSPAQLSDALTQARCRPALLAITNAGGWVVFVFGAPAFVNVSFPATLLANAPFVVRCA